MGIGKRIKEARKAKDFTQEQLAKKIGVTNGAIANYENDVSHPKEPILYALIDALGVDANYLFQDVVNLPTEQNDVTLAEYLFVKKYRQLPASKKAVVDSIVEALTDIQKPKKTKIIPFAGNAFAAGTGEPDFGLAWTDYEVDEDNPAEFAIRINGDSMEPWLPDGSIAFGKKETPRDGDIGAFFLDGEFLCKQACQDILGTMYLFSLNRDRADADVKIEADSGRNLLCFGTIIMDKKIPLPKGE